MDSVVWTDTLAIGVQVIDDQHRQLFDIRNRLASCLEPGADENGEHFHRILSELFEYTRSHFTAEEEIMQSAGFPDLTAHRQKHASFIDSLVELSRAAPEERNVRQQGVTFLTKWLLAHICQSDMEIRYFLEGRHG